MVKAIHNGVLFTGPQLSTTRRFARTVATLCIEHGAKNIEFYDGNDIPRLKELLTARDKRMTYFVSGAPCNYNHTTFLDEFSRVAIVHLDIDDDSGADVPVNPRHRLSISRVLSQVRGIPIVSIAGQEADSHRLHRIFRGLRDVSQPPIHPAIAEKVLSMSRDKPEFLTDFFAMV